jgi:hypothetical protein
VFTANPKNGYYRNCITRQVVNATSDMVTNGHIIHLVKLIKDAKEQIPELLRNKQELQAWDVDRLYVSSWAHLERKEESGGNEMPCPGSRLHVM